MSATNALENALLNTILAGNTYTGAANIYVSLYSVAPTESSGGTELVGNGYSRQETTFDITDNLAETTGNITFTASGNAWTVVAVGVMDASTSGNLLFYKSLSLPQNIDAGANLVIGDGNLTVTCD